MKEDFREEDELARGLVKALTPQRSFTGIRTQFVRDRLKETKWENRGYIGILMHLEDAAEITKQGRSWGWSGAMLYGRMKNDYPVEYDCIRREVEQGILTSPDEFMNLKTAHERRVAQLEAEAAERGKREADERRRRAAELKEQWRELGGRD
ncbi:MAG: hypothetical protein VB144_03630 [Clostridia bacterium]|nr:hypothetical protein [Clostridia bacterium]